MRHVHRANHPLRQPIVLGHTRNGTPILSIAGGADDDEGGDDDEDEDDDQDDDSDEDDSDEDDDQDDDEDKPLGPKGEKALEQWKKRAREAERELRKTKRSSKTTASKTTAKKTGDDDEDDPEVIRQKAREEAELAVAQDRALDKLEARAARKFADPEDARALLARQADDFLDDEGKPDVEAIDEALDELLEKKPHLAAQRDGKWKGSGDGGARRSKPQRPKSIAEAVGRSLTKD